MSQSVGNDVVRVHHGDCLTHLRSMPAESVHAIITDPPYGMSDHSPEIITKAIIAWASGDRERVPSAKGGFMGREWDSFVPPPAVWDECMRVLKPGGHMAVFCATRTVGLMDMSIRLAGFEMRDGIAAWLYGSGFPKSLDVGKAIDKAAGATREIVGVHHRHGGGSASSGSMSGDLGTASELPLTAPATDGARAWQGWGTALKPAHEPILMARKPLSGTVAATVLAHGTGAINIDATRVAHASEADRAESEAKNAHADFGSGARTNEVYGRDAKDRPQYDGSAGRWPTNVLLCHHPECRETGETQRVASNGASPAKRSNLGYKCDGNGTEGERTAYAEDGYETVPVFECHPWCHVAALDEQSAGTRAAKPAKSGSAGKTGTIYNAPVGSEPVDYGDSGGASRFFPQFRYQAKAGGKERPEAWGKSRKCRCAVPRPFDPETGALPPRWRAGSVCAYCEREAEFYGHSTVKPKGLMRWLLDLIVAPGGVAVDPFSGSGTTAEVIAERAAETDDGTTGAATELDEHSVRLAAVRLGADVRQFRSAPLLGESWGTTSLERDTVAPITAANSNTSRSGNDTTDEPSPTDTTCTMPTSTSSTTSLTTSYSSTSSHTSDSTPDASYATECGGNRVGSAASSSPSVSRTGTSRAKGGRSTDAAVRATSARSSKASEPVAAPQPTAPQPTAPPDDSAAGRVAACTTIAELTALHNALRADGCELGDDELWALVQGRWDELSAAARPAARKARVKRPAKPAWSR